VINIKDEKMSGGYFGYEQYKLGYIADEIEQLVRDNHSQEQNDWGQTKGHEFSDATIAEFKRGVELLNQALIYAQRIDWLVSGDDGEDTFHARLTEDLKNVHV
jgi:hypothetical protein